MRGATEMALVRVEVVRVRTVLLRRERGRG